MKRSPPRKPPRKKIRRPRPITGELAELAAILDERRLEQNAETWFSIPWNDGANAVGLCRTQEQIGGAPVIVSTAYDDAVELISMMEISGEVYHRAADLAATLARVHSYGALRAGLRCHQLLICGSSGDQFNDVLKGSRVDFDPDLVLRWRCFDAIGTVPTLMNDADDRRRRAFTIAWKRGLFHAAYAIGPTRRT